MKGSIWDNSSFNSRWKCRLRLKRIAMTFSNVLRQFLITIITIFDDYLTIFLVIVYIVFLPHDIILPANFYIFINVYTLLVSSNVIPVGEIAHIYNRLIKCVNKCFTACEFLPIGLAFLMTINPFDVCVIGR